MPPKNLASLTQKQKLIFDQLLKHDWAIDGNYLTLKIDTARLHTGTDSDAYAKEIAQTAKEIRGIFAKHDFDPDYWLEAPVKSYFHDTDWQRRDIPVPVILIHREHGEDVDFWFSQHLFALLCQRGADPAAHLR